MSLPAMKTIGWRSCAQVRAVARGKVLGNSCFLPLPGQHREALAALGAPPVAPAATGRPTRRWLAGSSHA